MYCGAIQMPACLASRMAVVSGGASWADECDGPIRAAAAAEDSVVRKPRRFCTSIINQSLLASMSHADLAQWRPNACSALQLTLELIENPPVGALRDEGCRARLDHARLAQPQGVKADRIIGIIVAPACVGNLLHGL